LACYSKNGKGRVADPTFSLYRATLLINVAFFLPLRLVSWYWENGSLPK